MCAWADLKMFEEFWKFTSIVSCSCSPLYHGGANDWAKWFGVSETILHDIFSTTPNVDGEHEVLCICSYGSLLLHCDCQPSPIERGSHANKFYDEDSGVFIPLHPNVVQRIKVRNSMFLPPT